MRLSEFFQEIETHDCASFAGFGLLKLARFAISECFCSGIAFVLYCRLFNENHYKCDQN